MVVEPAAPLDIHVDEELAHQPSQCRADAIAAPSLRLRLDAPDLEEHLQHDPLRLHKVCCLTIVVICRQLSANLKHEWQCGTPACPPVCVRVVPSANPPTRRLAIPEQA